LIFRLAVRGSLEVPLRILVRDDLRIDLVLPD
jgi:hypothetical protein